MPDVLEEVARVGIAGWIGESDDPWDTPLVLGTIGDELYLVEIDGSNREQVLPQIVDRYQIDDGSLRIEVVFFGSAGGFFASSMHYLEHWPKSPDAVPAEVFVDDQHKAAFDKAGDDIVMTVRHVLRPSHGPPRRQFRFRPAMYQEAISDLARESRRLRDDLIAIAQRQAPEKVESLRSALEHWPK